MPLAFAPVGQEMTITDIHAEEKQKKHLTDLGCIVGGKVTALTQKSGHLICRVLEGRIALDRTVAMRIIVR